MKQFISIIIPNFNGSRTIGKCLDSIFAVEDRDREVIVVDDGSGDESLEIIRQYPCRLVRLPQHSGASAARNTGAWSSKGEFLFFIDADCVLQSDTLSVLRKHLSAAPADVVLGGTYAQEPFDAGFFNLFQSVFVNHFETKNADAPDYLAAHALAIRAADFIRAGGFRETFLPMLEDVEFSHRLRHAGFRLAVRPDIQVRHIFNFSLAGSLRNAAGKTKYWIVYSLSNKDIFADSGTASKEIKITGGIWLVSVMLALVALIRRDSVFAAPLPFLIAACVVVNRRLLNAFNTAGGRVFAVLAGIYYCAIYPAAVWKGAISGIVRYKSMAGTGPAGSQAACRNEKR